MARAGDSPDYRHRLIDLFDAGRRVVANPQTEFKRRCTPMSSSPDKRNPPKPTWSSPGASQERPSTSENSLGRRDHTAGGGDTRIRLRNPSLSRVCPIRWAGKYPSASMTGSS